MPSGIGPALPQGPEPLPGNEPPKLRELWLLAVLFIPGIVALIREGGLA